MSAAIDQFGLASYRYIINHDIINCTADGVPGNRLFSGRALGLSEPWDIIQLHPDLQTQWDSICAHYDRIGLSHSKDVIWHVHREELGEHIGYHPSVFYFGPDECRYWGDCEWMDIVDFIDSRNNFIAVAAELGVDVPQTLCFDSPDQVTPRALSNIQFPCYAKAAVAVSDVGIHRCVDQDALHAALAALPVGTAIQIQEEVATDTFLNMPYRVVGNKALRLVASEQVLDGFAHRGDRVPARCAPWQSVDKFAQWLVDRGMKGVFAFDVAVVENANGTRYPAIECNPRFNGAAYPTFVAAKLKISEWCALAFSTSHRSLADIDLSGIEFDRESREGVVIVNWGPIIEGKILALFAGSTDRQNTLIDSFAARL